MKVNKLISILSIPLLLAAPALPALAQQPTAAERATMLKATVAASQVALRQLEWIETTVISLKGEEKSHKQERCYYVADGGIQKVAMSPSSEPDKKRGLRGRIVERKKEELTDYMKNAVGLVKTYVPPTPAKIQAAKDSGKVSIEVLDPGKRARLNFRNYQKPGDNLAVEIDLMSNRPLGLSVSTYLENSSDSVTLQVKMGQLDEGTSYPSDITLDAKAKGLTVTVKSTGYRKAR